MVLDRSVWWAQPWQWESPTLNFQRQRRLRRYKLRIWKQTHCSMLSAVRPKCHFMWTDDREAKGDLTNAGTNRRMHTRWLSFAGYEDAGSGQLLGDTESIVLKKGGQARTQTFLSVSQEDDQSQLSPSDTDFRLLMSRAAGEYMHVVLGHAMVCFFQKP